MSDEDNPFDGLCHQRRLSLYEELTKDASMIAPGDSDRIWYARGMLRLPDATEVQQRSCALLIRRTALRDEGLLEHQSSDVSAFADMATFSSSTMPA